MDVSLGWDGAFERRQTLIVATAGTVTQPGRARGGRKVTHGVVPIDRAVQVGRGELVTLAIVRKDEDGYL